ncbi:hypothetical protein D915_010341 [Fasciola hepatica]|uniref:Uncharacterized protein n=1 Tax=Fasciola hepatica TaxID=6192 RepID=A0A4E0RMV7_FASHE|nr:hypothetical protein D915_010341 [Fasciola hepatica]
MRTEQCEVACDKEEDENDNHDFDDEGLGDKDSLSDYDEDDDAKQSRSAGRHAKARGHNCSGNVGEICRKRPVRERSRLLLEPRDDNRRNHQDQLNRKHQANIKTS